jgi:hypothetical protein
MPFISDLPVEGGAGDEEGDGFLPVEGGAGDEEGTVNVHVY